MEGVWYGLVWLSQIEKNFFRVLFFNFFLPLKVVTLDAIERLLVFFVDCRRTKHIVSVHNFP